jgi:hypothetical protein
MGPFKLLSLAFMTTVTASTFYNTPTAPAVSTSVTWSEQVINVSTTIVKGPGSEPSHPAVVTAFPAAPNSSIMSVVPSVAPTVSTTEIHECMIYEGCVVPVNETASTTIYPGGAPIPFPPANLPPAGNQSTVVVTQTFNSTGIHHSATGSATVTASPTKPGMPVSSGGKVKVGAAIGLIALLFGVLGA